MNGGGELANNGEVKNLLFKYGYTIRPTTPAFSFQNSPGERPYSNIGTYKLWPFTFNYYLQICDLLPHSDRGILFEHFTGQRGDVRHMRTFGCTVVDKRNVKLD
jgi:hypothetical protein